MAHNDDLLRVVVEAFLTNDQSQTTHDRIRELLDPVKVEEAEELAFGKAGK